MAINPVAFDFNYELDVDVVCTPSSLVRELAGAVAALGGDTLGVEVTPDPAHQAIADTLKQADRGTLLIGSLAQMHPDFALLRALAANLAQACGAALGFVGTGANDTGAWMAGAVPHRKAGGESLESPGKSTGAMFAEPPELLMTLGFEPEMDVADPAAMVAAMTSAKGIALSAYLSPALEAHADVLLPIAGFAETSGSYVNLGGETQSFRGVAPPSGEARPGWKVLRVLGNLVDVDGFDYVESTEVRDEVLAACEGLQPDNTVGKLPAGIAPQLAAADWERIGGVPMYAIDATTRRAQALQHTPDAWGTRAWLNPGSAQALGLNGDARVRVVQDGQSAEFATTLDEAVPEGCIWLPTAVGGTEALGQGFAAVTVEKV